MAAETDVKIMVKFFMGKAWFCRKWYITRYSNYYPNKGLLCANGCINTNVQLMLSFAKIKCPALVLHIYFRNCEPALMLVKLDLELKNY